jgi:hypothetical protein
MVGAVQPKTSPGDKGLAFGIVEIHPRSFNKAATSATAERN